MLGVDWASGGTISYATAAKRITKAANVIANLRRYATAGVKYVNIARAHAIGAARYGCTTRGIPPKPVEKVRRMVRSSTSTTARGGSAIANMAFQKKKKTS